jgi:NAD(P)H-dependent flavin oxidoreductase YrpB (nitropropane dioxygenase family)
VKTALTALLGIDAPIVLAPMGGAVTSEFAAAVSNAGGMGMLPVSWSSPEEVGDTVTEMKALTNAPFGINLIREWDQRERLTSALQAGAPVISLFWGDPEELVREAHDGSALVFVTVASTEEAKRAAAAGADVIVAQGWEAGGHVRGEVATMALVPAVVDAVATIPVVAAGGIGDGRGVAAALMLGASAAWLGTRFVMSLEAPALQPYRDRMVAADATSTVYSSMFDGGWPDAPHRTLRNSTTDNWEAAGRPPPGQRPGEGETIGSWSDGEPIPRYGSDAPRLGASGDVEAMSMYAGQSVGLIDDVRPAGEIVRQLADETAAALKAGGGFVLP